MRAKRIPLKVSVAVLGALITVAAAGCSSEGKGGPVWTAGADSAAPGTATPSGGSTGPGSPSAASTATAGATASAWKTYSDPAKKVSFDLPSDWIAQSVTPDAGSMPGALKVEVKDAKGGYLATLHTGLPSASPADCNPAAKRPYVVVSSVPIDLPHADGDSTIPPHVVFRVIQGYKFFGSYGITNLVAGSDAHACQLRNLVVGPSGKGNYYFGDMPSLHAFATDEVVAPAKSFDTLDQAAKYVDQSSEFANVQRMLLSLKVNL
ncbi:hypothetical protein [Arthrobacter bambusae]|uniref:hypothetical protein n=1 Tax=Arthrobacter bambusae TaxID=1338426 RepID=UPI00278448B2|nr:hypothetical protein [Arthrobacter bambusae]MDQ0031225.1 hypothetical protein [Arthrobacter bambusae]MDQ0099485.1 hypothetical protein [Arthrobacter bambusae]